MNALERQVAALSDGVRRSPDIATLVGINPSRVRKIWKRFDLPRPRCGARPGEHNQAWRGGRKVDLDGYVLLQTRPTRILEHRTVMEKVLGRPLLPGEVVDHIDGITIHNEPSNLRVFASNGEHLRATAGGYRSWSTAGRGNIGARTDRGREIAPVDTYRLRKERGDVRLRAILRGALELGIEHPSLSGTLHWLEQNGIDPTSRPSLEQAWAALESRFAADLTRSQ